MKFLNPQNSLRTLKDFVYYFINGQFNVDFNFKNYFRATDMI